MVGYGGSVVIDQQVINMPRQAQTEKTVSGHGNFGTGFIWGGRNGQELNGF